jgi:hypothetical protein
VKRADLDPGRKVFVPYDEPEFMRSAVQRQAIRHGRSDGLWRAIDEAVDCARERENHWDDGGGP